jgi:hypothetical protein
MAGGFYQKATPCFKCEERHDKCHSSCKRYIEFKEKSRRAYYARLMQKNPYSVSARLYMKEHSKDE